MKELFEAINTRVKEPYWGFFVLSFLAFNWRGLFLLCFATGTAQEKIDLFDAVTTFWSLIFFPIATSLIILLITPWLKVLFGSVSRLAYEKLNSQKLVREHKYLAEKNLLEQERTRALANKENELIAQAKRDVDIEKIEDDSVKESLKREIDELRKKRNDLVHYKNNLEIFDSKGLSNFQKRVLIEIFQSDDGCIERREIGGSQFVKVSKNVISDISDKQLYLRYLEAINVLVQYGLLKDLNNEGVVYELTAKGKNVVNSIGV